MRLLSARSGQLRPGWSNTIGPLIVGLCAFGYTFLSQRALSNDHYMHLALAQQVLLGDVPGRDFVDPGMPLEYALSAVVQHIWPGPFSEVLLTSVLLSVAAALTYLVVRGLTGYRVAGVGAAAFQVLLDPRLYGYPKILVPAATLWAFSRYAEMPTRGRRVALGFVTAIGMLLRHDLGLFAFAAVCVGFAVIHSNDWRAGTRECARFAGVVLLGVAPYLLLVQISEGLVENFRESVEFSRGEVHQLLLPWIRLPASDGASDPSVVLYYTAYLLVALGLVWVASTRTRQVRATAAAAVTLLTCFCLVVLRHPLPSRVADLGAVLAVVGVCVLVEAARQASRFRVAPVQAVAGIGLLLVTASPIGAAWQLGKPLEHLKETRIADGWEKVAERVGALASVGTKWPWRWYWPGGDMPDVVQYVSECTAPDDRILLTWFAPEYHFFSRRGFAAGHSFFSPGPAFATATDTRKMVLRMRMEMVPLVLRSESTREKFAESYPALDAFIDEHYDWFGEFALRDGSLVRLGLRRDLRPTSRFGPRQWPCGFETSGGSGAGELRLNGKSAGAAALPAI